MKTPTLRDVALQAGVSITLVSRILNKDPHTRATTATRARVSRVAAELGYRPNVTARALKSSRTHTIGVIAPDLTNALFAELMLGIEDRSRQAGYAMLLGRAESLYDNGQAARMIERGRVDGLVIQGRDEETTELLTELVTQVPSVLVHRRLPGHSGSVMIDDAAAARLATQNLIELGHRRIGLISGPPALLTAQRREAGYRAALREHGIRAQSRLITRFGYSVHSAKPAVDELLSNRSRPTALVVSNVNAALGVLTALRTLGLRVPEDISVIGIHDAWVCDHSWPPLTTVRTPLYEMGRLAVELLQRRMDGETPDDLEVTNPLPELIIRASTGTAR